MTNAFEEAIEEVEEKHITTSGDRCPEEKCDKCVRELNHERTKPTTIPAHPDVSDIEVVCPFHGIVATR